MIVVSERNEAEGLQDVSLLRSQRMQHFRHSVHVAGASLKRDLDEIAFIQSLGQVQHAAGGGNGLKAGLGLDAVALLDQGLCRGKLNSGSTMESVDLRVMCHAAITMALAFCGGEITEAQCPGSMAFGA